MARVCNPANRNKAFILQEIERYVGKWESNWTALEIASGTGTHTGYFAKHFPKSEWQPTDYCDEDFESIMGHAAENGAENIRKPLIVNAADSVWSNLEDEQFNFAFNCNMIHITPLAVTEGFFKTIPNHLKKGGLLMMYGPYKVDGKFTTPSNEEFDRTFLKVRNPEYGLRDLDYVKTLAEDAGLVRLEVKEMPANNFLVVYQKPE